MSKNYDSLKTQYDLCLEKLNRLRHAFTIETDEARKFQLEKQIAQEEKQLDKINQKINKLEKEVGFIEPKTSSCEDISTELPKVFLQKNDNLYVHIEKENGNYYCRITNKLGNIPFGKFKVALNENCEIERDVTLGQVAKQFKNNNVKELDEFFSIPRQISIGVYLYNQIFGSWLDRQVGENIETEIFIISKDKFINQLPWALLSDNGNFLASSGWHIRQALFHPKHSIKLKKFVKILVILPQPKDLPSTFGLNHFEMFQKLLYSISSDQTSSQYLIEAKTWEEVENALNYKPEIIYYYGHGIYEEKISSLMLEKENTYQSIPILELKKLLKIKNVKPKLIYLNCCSGDTGGLLGAGNQLSEIVPVVITNRTIAYIDSSQEIAINFFQSILREGLVPVKALNIAIQRINQKGIRCFTPVCYATYESWKKEVIEPPKKRYRDSQWLITIDRTDQCPILVWRIQEMLLNRKPHGIAFLWYGEPEEGVDIFHERFEYELKKKVHNISKKDYSIRWGIITAETDKELHQSFQEIFCQLFGIKKLQNLKTHIGKLHPYIDGKIRLVCIHHEPVDLRYNQRIDPDFIEQYLRWWSKYFLNYFPKDIHVLLGLSFILSDEMIDDFPKDLEDILLEYSNPNFKTLLLPQLPKLGESDLKEFIQTHQIPIPTEEILPIIKKILGITGGSYQKTLDLLENIEHEWYKYITFKKKTKKTWGWKRKNTNSKK